MNAASCLLSCNLQRTAVNQRKERTAHVVCYGRCLHGRSHWQWNSVFKQLVHIPVNTATLLNGELWPKQTFWRGYFRHTFQPFGQEVMTILVVCSINMYSCLLYCSTFQRKQEIRLLGRAFRMSIMFEKHFTNTVIIFITTEIQFDYSRYSRYGWGRDDGRWLNKQKQQQGNRFFLSDNLYLKIRVWVSRDPGRQQSSILLSSPQFICLGHIFCFLFGQKSSHCQLCGWC